MPDSLPMSLGVLILVVYPTSPTGAEWAADCPPLNVHVTAADRLSVTQKALDTIHFVVDNMVNAPVEAGTRLN